MSEIDGWDERGADGTLFTLLDQIENDLIVVLASGLGRAATEDSTYVMHCSWAAECSAAAMLEALPKAAVATLTNGIGKILVMESEAASWVKQWNVTAKELLRTIAEATNVDTAMAGLIALDIMLTNMVSYIGAMRLNPLLDRQRG